MPRPLVDPRLLATLPEAFPLTIQPQEVAITRDAFGAEVSTWANLGAAVACCLWPDKGTEVRRPDQTLSVATHKALLAAYRSDLTTQHRMTMGAWVFDVLAVEHDSQHLATRLLLEVVT